MEDVIAALAAVYCYILSKRGRRRAARPERGYCVWALAAKLDVAFSGSYE
mgnify:CR=1 FL=1